MVEEGKVLVTCTFPELLKLYLPVKVGRDPECWRNSESTLTPKEVPQAIKLSSLCGFLALYYFIK